MPHSWRYFVLGLPCFLITARVRTYDGRLCFHRCVSVQLSGGGGTPSQVWVGGYPISGLGGGGYPIPGPGPGGYPVPGPGGYPIPSLGVYPIPGPQGYPIPGPGGYPIPGLGEVLRVPSPPNQVWIRQSSTASTSYAAGGVPLAFTQEDFLVLDIKIFLHEFKIFSYTNLKSFAQF